MSYEYLNKYDDFINTYDMLYHLQPNHSIDEFFQQIQTILIEKYKVQVDQIIRNLVNACKWNYRSIDSYIKILNMLFTKYSQKTQDIKKIFRFGINNDMKYKSNDDEICVIESDANYDEIDLIIMNDQIDKFKEFLIGKSPEDIKIYTSDFSLDVLEACAYFGSVNIFIYLISELKYQITYECQQFAVIGRNTDIINECIKNQYIHNQSLEYAILSHNNDFIEDIIRKNLIDFKFFKDGHS
ncbi:hypothetical protein TVAG_169110 [Trichomonas vaginalis G3]|uniref:DUF3447 domain-containing protein n=1 Tax=Trichomonas vaginalis (strain ATCC PRA-98 / G3) TaxID=412133 RepID=A2EWS9_TRIV3|nr:hypothetical protein TVAG_169110 [Trichomonas vaginalis G3]|eukprot:XP_001315132.1 hypothetical protein [Trichomonas vaginalis G3]